MADLLIACRACGSTTFHVLESYSYRGEIDPDRPGIILVSNPSYGGVDDVRCAQCDTEPEGYEIEFC